MSFLCRLQLKLKAGCRFERIRFETLASCFVVLLNLHASLPVKTTVLINLSRTAVLISLNRTAVLISLKRTVLLITLIRLRPRRSESALVYSLYANTQTMTASVTPQKNMNY